jgi:DNA mismatch repair protein MutS2
MNACVEFDVNTLSPTYRLLFGLPGKSNAYIIAERLGLPQHLIQRARELMGDDLHKVDHLIQKLTTESQEIEKQKAEAEARIQGVTQLEKETDRLLALAEEERQEILHKALEEAKQIVEQALHRSQEVLTKLPSTTRETGKTLVKTLHKEVETVRQKTKKLKKDSDRVPDSGPSDVAEGQQVQIRGVGRTGIILSLLKDQKHAEVQVGEVKLEVPVSQLTPLASSQSPSRLQKISVSEVAVGENESDIIPSELVIVGKHVDEALDDIDKYLDQAFLLGYSSVAIVHGIGTGKLKQAVSTLLRSHPHVIHYSLDDRNQGMTVAHLKRR